jgi:molybdenum cofactor cytidylyltransferase
VAEDWAEGLAASLRRGVEALPPGSEGLLLFLGDMPLSPPAVGDRALAALKAGAIAVEPVHAGAPAHPVGLSSRLYDALRTLSGDAGARQLLRTLTGVARIETDDAGSVFDVDRPGDLANP